MPLSQHINLVPPSWTNSPEGYIRHQKLLVDLVDWLEAQDIPLALPNDEESDRDHDDHGVDLIVANTRIDLKSFGLKVYRKTHTWSSPFYKGQPAPLRKGLLTDWFVHPNGLDVGDWLAAPRAALRTSRYGHQPYYFSQYVVPLDELVQDQFTRHEI